MTLKQAAKDALQVQSACNLSGVVHSMFEALRAVRAEATGYQSTGSVNTHPIAQLYAYKVSALAGFESLDFGLSEEYRAAEAECRRLAEEEE